MVSTTQVAHAARADVDAVAGLIAEAFHTLDVSAWLIDTPHERTRVLAANFAIIVEHAIEHGEVHRIDGPPVAVAVWLHQRVPPLPPPADYDRRLAAACGPWTDRFCALDDAFDEHHPHDVAHQHLALLAVRPHLQGNELGSTLMRHHHRQLDATGTPAYLEASSPRSRDFYLRHGYRMLTGEPFYLPDGPPLWPMWRDPDQS